MVYVISKTGQPLMPTNRYGKVRHLLKSGKAKVVKRCPFTIKLLYECTNHIQHLKLGVDTGSSTVGNAVCNNENKIYYMSKVMQHNDISDKMTQRRNYRKTRRNRKTRYRKSKFLNRKNSIRTGRFSPTMTSKLYAHVKEIEFIKRILPIHQIILETGQFDTHLMVNPSLANEKIRHWGYQKGPNYGFENTKARILCRDQYTCQICKNKRNHTRLEVHHIVYRSQGGSDEEENLITLCDKCHKEIHSGKIKADLHGKVKSSLKYATQMNYIRKQLLQIYPDAIETFGYITKANRQMLNMKKDHHIDACLIASDGNPVQYQTNVIFIKRCISKGDYQQTQGKCSDQPIITRKICGFRKFDKVNYFGNTYFIKGRMSSGYAILMDINGKKIDFSYMSKGYKTPKMSNLTRIGARKSWMITKEVDTVNIA